ncbi:MAG: F0F1 ATP synthase subunit A, partial [Rhodospirillales bacterium]|nr:F0F1 ATP synthase subunit A [Rhodospirillales bacterium]
MASPLEQFQIKPIAQFSLAGYDLAYTNSALMMTVAALAASALLIAASRGARLVPGRLQSVGELMY